MVTKLSAKFEIPGATLYSPAECESNKKFLNNETVKVSYFDKKNKGKKAKPITEFIHFSTAKSKPAIQVVNISDETYNYWISEGAPAFVQQKEWKKMNNILKIEAHLRAIGDTINGKLVDYSINND